MSSKNRHNQQHGSTIERSDERIKQTQEVFTPTDLINLMIDDIPIEQLKNPNSRFMDNCAGSGNFIVCLYEALQEYHSKDHIINNMLYAVELMEDNHKEMCRRLDISVDHPHFVCADALQYHYRFDGSTGPVTMDMFVV
tara:strand:- start:27 stop:443 length:417 start_codon:yes stop_codon:yes gene_type:complete